MNPKKILIDDADNMPTLIEGSQDNLPIIGQEEKPEFLNLYVVAEVFNPKTPTDRELVTFILDVKGKFKIFNPDFDEDIKNGNPPVACLTRHLIGTEMAKNPTYKDKTAIIVYYTINNITVN